MLLYLHAIALIAYYFYIDTMQETHLCIKPGKTEAPMYFQLHDIRILLSIKQAEALLAAEKCFLGLGNGSLTQTTAVSSVKLVYDM